MNKIYFKERSLMTTVAGRTLCAVLLAQLLLFGCEKPPTDAIIRAERLIEDARKGEADIYAFEVILKADKAIKKAKDLVAAKKYGEAKKSAADAVQHAQEAITLAKSEKERLTEEAENMMRQIGEMLGELRQQSEKRVAGRSKGVTEKLRSAVEKYGADLAAAREELEKGQITQALLDLTILKDLVSETEVKQAAKKTRKDKSWK